ncbi:MAG: hypothetical protein JWL86_511 [Rhizobium sp.]|nr:hypothetical protein [Rhizobium sp.]
MDMQWNIIWQYSSASGRTRKDGPFADPLNGPEWEGLVWVPVLVASIGRRFANFRLAFPIRNSARGPVKAVPDHGVCVS